MHKLERILPSGGLYKTMIQVITEQFMPYKGIKVQKIGDINDLNYKNYITILGEDELKHKYIIAILKDGYNPIVSLIDDMKSFIKNNVNKNQTTIVVGSDSLSAHIQTHVNSIPFEQLQFHHYDIFKVVLPLMPYVPNHEVVDNTEKLLADLNIKKIRMKQINKYDPQLIWTNARVGDLIKLHNLSPLVGISIDYRIVV